MFKAIIDINMDYARLIMPYATNDLVRMAALHKARYELKIAPRDKRKESEYWLKENGFKRLHGLEWPDNGEPPE